MSGTMMSARFRQEREADWRRLESLLARLEGGSLRTLTDAELLALPGLYRAALSALSVARETSLDQQLIAYLEALSTRAYFLVYGTRTGLGTRLRRFFVTDWPAATRALWPETLWAWVFTLGGAALASYLVMADPDWYDVFVPSGLANGRDASASTEALRASLYTQGDAGSYGLFAATLMAHNAQIAITAFALGFAFGVPTAILLVYNGAVLGAFIALFAGRGLGWQMGAWLAVHGVTEMMAVAFAGRGWAAHRHRHRPARRTLPIGLRRACGPSGRDARDGLRRHAGDRWAAGGLAAASGDGRCSTGRDRRRDVPGLVRVPVSAASMSTEGGRTRPLLTPEGVQLTLVLAEASQRLTAFMLDIAGMALALLLLTSAAFVAGLATGLRLGIVIWVLGFFLLRNFYFRVLSS